MNYGSNTISAVRDAGVGVSQHDFTPFTSPKIGAEISILITNGIYSIPQVDIWFLNVFNRNFLVTIILSINYQMGHAGGDTYGFFSPYLNLAPITAQPLHRSLCSRL